MFSLEWQLRALHVMANLVWIGSILAVGILLIQSAGSPPERGVLARGVYTKLAVPAFLVAFLTGVLRLVLDLPLYFEATRFMHAKLPLALCVVALHHVLGARARRLSNGKSEAAGNTRFLTSLLAVLALGSAWLALSKPF